MANKNRNLIIAYFPSYEKAEQAAEDLKHWDKQNMDIKLGGIGIMTADEDGKLKTHKVGSRAGGTGAKWGLILGAVTGVLSGGITLIGGAIAGLAAGTVAGALFHKKIGMSDEEKDLLVNHLKGGGAALAVMADDEEVESTKFQLSSQGGQVKSYNVPDEEMEELEAAADEEGIEELDEVVVLDEGSHVDEVAEIAAAAAVAEAVAGDDEVEDIVVEEVGEETEIVVDEEGEVAAEETTAVAEAEAVDEEGHVLAAAAAAATAAAVVSSEDEGDEVVQEEVEVDAVYGDEEGHVVETMAAAAAVGAVMADDEEAVAVEEAEVVEEVVEPGPETAVLHFKRFNGDYDSWGIHVWYGCKHETNWTQPLPPIGMDDFGLVFEVPLAEDAPGLAYIIHRGDEKDHWDDQYLDFSQNGREVWIVQNTPGYLPAP